MAAEMQKPSPPGRWEKALMRPSWWFFFAAISVGGILSGPLGLWPSVAVMVAVMATWTFVVARLAASEREGRLLRDVERGVIECAIRDPKALPGSLSWRWERGFAEVNNGTIKFQPMGGEMVSPAGKVREFSELSSHGLVDFPAKKPAELMRSWKIAAIGTDKGELEVATGEAGVALILRQTDLNTGNL
jgi:hypothetical protein